MPTGTVEPMVFEQSVRCLRTTHSAGTRHLACALRTTVCTSSFAGRRAWDQQRARSPLALTFAITDMSLLLVQPCLTAGGTSWSTHAIAQRSLPVMPEWLIRLSTRSVPQPLRRSGYVSAAVIRLQLNGLLRVAAQAISGKRNKKLYWAACRCGELVAQQLLTPEDAMTLCL